MCGISGIFGKEKDSHNIVKSMVKSLTHRGPDNEDIFESQNICLGHNRLSIIDLSKEGHQPMSNSEQNLWIVFNGEIFNYIELRNLVSDYHFKSDTDTEVILHLYHKFGSGCLKFLNGMFSFSIWDKRNKTLFCARDRFGIKPFYYYVKDQSFYFASEIRALQKIPSFSKSINSRMVKNFILNGSLNYANQTFIKDIVELPPSNFLIINFNSRKISIDQKKYYSLNIKELKPSLKLFDKLLNDSVKLRLRSDVPIGLALSGGLDSSSLAYYIKKSSSNNKVKTFTAVTDDEKTDESKYASRVSDFLGLECIKVNVKIKNLSEDLSRVTANLEQPVSGPSIIYHSEVMEQIKKHKIKVMLHGQGADEILAGYNFQRLHLADELRKKKFITFFKELVNNKLNNYSSHQLSTTALGISSIKAALDIGKDFEVENAQKYFSNLKLELPNIKPKNNLSLLKNKLINYIQRDNLPYILQYEDRNSMACSIESRTPFLDYRLVNYCLNIPSKYLFDSMRGKYILKKCMKNRIPNSIIERKKVGFSTPRDKILTDFKSDIESSLDSSFLVKNKIIASESLKKLTSKYYKSVVRSDSQLLWRVIAAEEWIKQNSN